jgi:NAD(P)H dehydrogenase (quinone)
MKKNIVIILGHPLSDSLNHRFAKTYEASARSKGANVTLLNLEDMDFDPVLHASDQPLEPSLVSAQSAIAEANHLVFVFPTWWASLPAKLKGFIDRAFISGFAFKFEKGRAFPIQLLKGKTAEIISTMDAPAWYYKFFYGSPIEKQLKRGVLNFCGISKVKEHLFYQTKDADEDKREQWLAKVAHLAHQAVAT